MGDTVLHSSIIQIATNVTHGEETLCRATKEMIVLEMQNATLWELIKLNLVLPREVNLVLLREVKIVEDSWVRNTLAASLTQEIETYQKELTKETETQECALNLPSRKVSNMQVFRMEMLALV